MTKSADVRAARELEGWVIDVYAAPGGRSPLGESICRLSEPERSRAVEALFDFLRRGAVAAGDASKRFPLPSAKQFQGEEGLGESSKGPLGFIYTTAGQRILLLDVLEKRTAKLSPDKIKRLRRLQVEARRAVRR